jgi:hypothetical protein
MSAYAGVPCFWLERTGTVALSLRRFSFGIEVGEEPRLAHRGCPSREPSESTPGYVYRQGCDASAELGIEVPLETYTDDDGYLLMSPVPEHAQPGHDDPRWPVACSICGGAFLADDVWQVNQAEVYIRSDTGERVAFRGYGDKRFAGALFDAWWLKGKLGEVQARAVAGVEGAKTTMVGADEIALVAICPNGGAWGVDGPGTGGGSWTRTGDPRQPETLSVSPSIVCGDYHGFLQAGRFTDG